MPQIGLAIAGAFNAFSASSVGVFLTQTFLGRLLTTVSLTALSQYLAREQMRNQVQPGIRTEISTSGEAVVQGTVLGWYATAGHMLCPPMTHGTAGGVPNAYLTYVLALADLPGLALDQLLVNDEVVALGPTAEAAGYPATGTYAGKLWARYWDGTQSAADPWLVTTFGDGTAHATDTGRPWGADMVGPGVCYLVVTFRYDRTLFNSFPKVVAVLHGIPLYDPRKDSTVGGSGAHRWSDPATWETSRNPMQMIYAILRGIDVPGGEIWGLGVAAEDLPLSNWFAAMNACDAVIDGAAAYQAGIEISFGDEPATVIEDLQKVCSGQLAEVGGVWKATAGAPGLPVYYFSDDDMIITEASTFTPFGSLSQTFNGVQATYPDPDALWQAKDAPPRHDASLEATDQGRVLTASLTFNACPFPAQVQRLMLAYLNDERRFRRHSLALPPDAAILEPLDVVSWSSTANGYDGKLFEISEIGDDLGTLLQRIAMRERDPADYNWEPGFVLPWTTSPVTPVRPAPIIPAGFAATGIAIEDASGRGRRAAILLDWTGTELDGLTGMRWEIRRAGVGEVVERGSMADAAALTVTVTGAVLPATSYQARIGFLAPGMAVDWTAWAAATTPAVVITTDDFDTTPPSVPTGLALASVLADGGGATLQATWTASAEADFADYEVRIRQGAGNHVSARTAINRQEWTVPRGTLFYVSLRAADRLGNLSAWSAEVSHTTAIDTVAPAVPTGLAVSAGFEVLWLNWTANADADFSHYGIYESTTTTAPGVDAAPTFVTQANALARTGLEAGVTRHYWIRAFDTSGNKSAWSARVPGTTTALAAPDISGIIDATSFATGIEPVTIVPGTVLPTVKSTTAIVFQGKLYRWDGAAYVATVAATDLTGTLTADQIAANTITAAQIAANTITGAQIAAGAVNAAQVAAGAITTSKMAIGDTTNLWSDYDLSDPDLWASTTGAAFTLVAVAQPRLGKFALSLPNDAIAHSVESAWVRCEPGSDYWVEAKGWVVNPAALGLVVSVSIEFASNAEVITRRVLVGSKTAGYGSISSAMTINVFTADTETRFRFVVEKTAVAGPTARCGALIVRRRAAGELIVDGAIIAAHLSAGEIITGSAQIRDAIITNAKVVDLSAAKLTAGSALAGSITVSGTALSDTTTRAGDPAARINAGVTTINPGNVVISGATLLSDWRQGGDTTRIAGGAISANTISANKLMIGNRNVTTTIEFEHNSPTTNSISWTSGVIRYINDAGAIATTAIAAGNTAWTAGVVYIYWAQGATTLSSTTSLATAMAANNVILATYHGGTVMVTDYGRTVIDGSNIKTGTVTADRMVAGTITAASGIIANAAITTANIVNAAITGAKIGDAEITSAKIADSIQSTDYAAGVAGWKIDKAGDAEFNTLVVRQDMLAAGSTVVHASASYDTTIFSHGVGSVSQAEWGTSTNNTFELVMMSIDLVTSGARVVLEADFFWEYLYTPTTPYLSNWATPGILLLRRKTSGVWTTIRTLVLPNNVGDGRDFGHMAVRASDLPGAGTHTFALTFQKRQNASSPNNYSPTLQLKSRFIGATEYRQAS